MNLNNIFSNKVIAKRLHFKPVSYLKESDNFLMHLTSAEVDRVTDAENVATAIHLLSSRCRKLKDRTYRKKL